MERFRKLFAGILGLSMGVFTLVSCNDDSPVPLKAVVDVMIQDIKTDAGVKYGVVIYATSNYELKSATITAPGTGGKVYQLTASADKRQFVYVPQAADYTTELPVKGDYSFEIVSTDNEKLTGKDVLGEEKLAAISIKTAAMTNHLLKTTWDKVTNAESYVVKLYSANKSEVLFSSTLLGENINQFEFGANTQGWVSGKSPVANTDYVVELLGIRFETGTLFDAGNNVQFITLDSKTIKWE